MKLNNIDAYGDTVDNKNTIMIQLLIIVSLQLWPKQNFAVRCDKFLSRRILPLWQLYIVSYRYLLHRLELRRLFWVLLYGNSSVLVL